MNMPAEILDPLEVDESLYTAALQRQCEITMEKWFVMSRGLGVTEARTKEEFYGFRAADIVDVYTHLMGYGDGVFFRLRDGRVFNVAGRQCNPDPMLYDQTAH